MLATKTKIQILQSHENLTNHILQVLDKYSQQTRSIKRLVYLLRSICKNLTGNIALSDKKAKCFLLGNSIPGG